jgi:nitrite reductase/ring-hydroxylating ferredoxin subunit
VVPLADRRSAVVVVLGDRVDAWVNRCPHLSVELDRHGDDIWDPTSSELVCTVHAARFEPQSGLCIDGPCEGLSLERLPVELVGATVVLRRPPLVDGPMRVAAPRRLE